MTTNNNIFRQFIKSHPSAMPVLPAVHVTWATNINNILQTNKLLLTRCKYYKKDLIYLFYGKPAYRLKRGSDLVTRLQGDAVLCFVLNMIKLPKVYRVFALDTWAWFSNRYDQYLPKGLSIDDFELDADNNSGAQLVSAFFRRNKNYFKGEVKSDIRIAGADIVSDAYRGILTAPVTYNFDERACTCELQYAAELEINRESVHSIIIPDTMNGDIRVRKKMKEWGVKPILYEFRRGKPEDRTESIFDRLGGYYRRKRFL